MTSTDEVLSMYENIAGLTGQMASAARARDWDGLRALEDLCADQAGRIEGGAVPALSGAARLRKIDLLKKILADDRAIRTVTEPWMLQLTQAMAPPRHRR